MGGVTEYGGSIFTVPLSQSVAKQNLLDLITLQKVSELWEVFLFPPVPVATDPHLRAPNAGGNTVGNRWTEATFLQV